MAHSRTTKRIKQLCKRQGITKNNEKFLCKIEHFELSWERYSTFSDEFTSYLKFYWDGKDYEFRVTGYQGRPPENELIRLARKGIRGVK